MPEEPTTKVDPGMTQAATPLPDRGFGSYESALETRQAQHQQANDVPTDVNMNAVFGREQGATLVLMGKNFEANADRRNKVADFIFQKLATP